MIDATPLLSRLAEGDPAGYGLDSAGAWRLKLPWGAGGGGRWVSGGSVFKLGGLA
jgi:hypothetical protein